MTEYADQSSSPKPVVCHWLCEPMSAEVAMAIDRLAASDDVKRIAVMPDAHLAHDVCVGTVLATSTLLYPQAVGGDIGCGLATVAFDAGADIIDSDKRAARLLQGLYARIPGNRHRRQTMPASLPATLDPSVLSNARLSNIARRDGLVQLGTLGRGNHFVEMQADDDARVWVMVHSGSRAVGPAIRDHHFERCSRLRSGHRAVEASSEPGAAYLADVLWAREYARCNRRAIIDAVCNLIKEEFLVNSDESTRIDVDHNHVQTEPHFGESLWVHRKGASDAHVGVPGLIPGSMGTATFHTEGRGEVESLCSSSHGAGRAMSRDEARRTIGVRAVERSLDGIWFDHRQLHALREESPDAYRDIHAVMRAQRELTKVCRRLRPLLSFKAT